MVTNNDEEDLITFDDEPEMTSEIGEASTSMAELKIRSPNNDEIGFECIATKSSTRKGLTAQQHQQQQESNGDGANTTLEEEHTFQIKDVTDYSQASVADSLEIAPSESSEGLLRGWSQDFEEGQNQGLMDIGGVDNDPNCGEGKVPENQREKALKALKKGAVAVTGTALVVAGIPLIPMPTPGGVIVSGSGLALLATEFPAAQRVLDRSRDGLEKMVGKEEDDEDDEDDDKSEKEKNDNDFQDDSRSNRYAKLGEDGADDFMSLRSNATEYSERSTLTENSSFMAKSHRSTEQRIDDAIKSAKKTSKKTKKNLKKFVRGTILPLMSKITTEKEKPTDADSVGSSAMKAEGGKSSFRDAKKEGLAKNGMADIPENFLSNTKLRNHKNENQNKFKSPSKNLEGAFPVRVPMSTPPTEDLLDSY